MSTFDERLRRFAAATPSPAMQRGIALHKRIEAEFREPTYTAAEVRFIMGEAIIAERMRCLKIANTYTGQDNADMHIANEIRNGK